MFKGCSSLTFLDIANLNLSSIIEEEDIFDTLDSLRYINLFNVTDNNNMISGSNLDKIKDLIACHHDNIILSSNSHNVCCDFDFETHECAKHNYIKVYYKENCNYNNGFKHKKRNNIHFIYYGNITYTDKEELKLTDGSILEINFKFPIDSLENFFDSRYDKNMQKVESIDLTKFNLTLSGVNNMENMFYGCSSLKSIYFSSFTPKKFPSMSQLFSGCSSLLSINLSGFVSSDADDLSLMFEDCTSIKSIDISNFYLPNNFKYGDMFRNVNNLKYINLYNVQGDMTLLLNSQLNKIDNLFFCQGIGYNLLNNQNAKNICCEYDIENDICRYNSYIVLYYSKDVKYSIGFINKYKNEIAFIYNGNEMLETNSSFTIKAGTKIELHFNNAMSDFGYENLFDVDYGVNNKYIESIDLSHFDTSLATSFSKMFKGCTSLKSVNLSYVNSSRITDMSMMFYSCSSLISSDLSYLNTSNLINTRQMFQYCSSLIAIDLLYFNLDKITDSAFMFNNININVKYFNFYHTIDNNKIISNSVINNANGITVCQQEKLIDNTKANYTCCDFNIEKLICENNYVTMNLNSEILYVGSNNALTNKIKFIKSNNQMIVDLRSVYLSKGNVEFHFNSPLSDLSYLFSQNENEIMNNVDSIDLTYLDTSSINNTKHMFELCSSLKSIDFTNFNTSNVVDMSYMFYNCPSLEVLELSLFNTKNVISTEYMFSGCSNLKVLKMYYFDFSNINKYNSMFQNINNLKYIDINRAKDPNSIISGSSINEINDLIVCQRNNIITNTNIINKCCHFDIETNECEMKNYIIVYYGKEVEYSNGFVNEYRKDINFIIHENSTLSDTDSFTVKAGSKIEIHFAFPITSLESFFSIDDENVEEITSIDLSHFDSSSLTSFYASFFHCSSLTSIDFTNINTQSLKDMSYMFYECTSLKSIDLSNFDTSSVTSLESTFRECASLISLDLSNFNTSNLLFMDYTFNGCISLKYLDLSGLDLSERSILIDFSFTNCINLKYINVENTIFNSPASIGLSVLNDINNLIVCQNSDIIKSSNSRNICCDFNIETDLCQSSNYIVLYYGKAVEYNSDFVNEFRNDIFLINNGNMTINRDEVFTINPNTKIEILFSSPITSIENFFNIEYDNRVADIISLDLSHLYSSLITSLYSMVKGCSSLELVDFNNFNASLINNMQYTFDGCTSLKSLDLSNFDTSSLTIMSYTFRNCSSLAYINLSNFNTSKVNNFTSLFDGCNSLKSINLYNFDTSLVTNMAYMFRGCSTLELINLSNFDTSSLSFMDYMLYGCSSLKLLDLSGLDLSKIEGATNLLDNAEKLKYITLYDIQTNQKILDEIVNDEQLNNKDNLIICQNSDIIKNEKSKQICCDYNIETDLCESNNYIIVYYGKEVEYSNGFVNEYRKDINFIIHENSTLSDTGSFTVKAGSKIEIHFAFPITSLESFFSIDDENVEEIASIDLSHFDSSSLNSTYRSFYGCNSLESIDFDNFITSSITNMSYMFYNCVSLKSIDLTNFDTSSVNDMSYMFSSCNSLQSINLSNFNTSSVNNMAYMFSECNSLKQINLTNFDSSLVTNMDSLFYNCSLLESIELSNLNTSSVTYMGYMFDGCNSLKSIDLSNFNTSLVIDMKFMFHRCESLESIDISNFDLSSVYWMNEMFYECKLLKEINFSNSGAKSLNLIEGLFYGCSSLLSIDLTAFKESHITDMGYLFYNCTSLQSVDLSNFDTSLVNYMSFMFYGCSSLKLLDISGFNFSQIKDCSYMFYNLKNLKYLNLDNIDVGDKFINESGIVDALSEINNLIVCQNSEIITNSSTRSFCCDYNIQSDLCQSSNYIVLYYLLDSNYKNGFKNNYRNNINFIIYENFTKFDTDDLYIRGGSNIEIHFKDNITDMNKFFSSEEDINSQYINSIDLSRFDSSHVVNMSSMFSGCSSLTYINFSNIITSSVIDMSNMFENCGNISSLDLSNFDTSKVIDMSSMFSGASSLKLLNLSNFYTTFVKNMSRMFLNDTLKETIDISQFIVENVSDMSYMFSGCSLLKNIYYLSNLQTYSEIDKTNMFYGCKTLLPDGETDYGSSNNGTSEVVSQTTVVMLGFNMYSKIGSIIIFNIYFFFFESFEFPDKINFTANITYRSLLRVLDNNNQVNCEKLEINDQTKKVKYNCTIDSQNGNIDNIALNQDVNFGSQNLNLVISPLASEYINKLQNLPDNYDDMFDNSTVYILEKSKLSQNEKKFNISGEMNENPNSSINKNIVLMAEPESEDEEKEINCNIVSTNLDNYILECGLNNKIKYELNNSLSIVDNDILLVNFDDGNSTVQNTIVKGNYYRKFFYNKNSGLSGGALAAIILVPILALVSILAVIFYNKRKNIASPPIDNSTQTNINIQTKI